MTLGPVKTAFGSHETRKLDGGSPVSEFPRESEAGRPEFGRGERLDHIDCGGLCSLRLKDGRVQLTQLCATCVPLKLY